MKFFNWQNIRLVLMIAAMGGLLAFTSERNEKRFLSRSEVVFTGAENQFLTRDMVNKLLIENNSAPQTIRKDKVDLNRLERAIDRHRMIEKSEVFVSIDGVLKAVVKQKTPIARVVDEGESFYIDYKGNRMPLSEVYSARVPLLTGRLDEKNLEGIAEMFRMIHRDDFLKKNIISAVVSPAGSISLMSREFDYVIDFGKTVNMGQKFRNYKAFYQKAVLDSTIKKYKVINLKFAQQVVCSK